MPHVLSRSFFLSLLSIHRSFSDVPFCFALSKSILSIRSFLSFAFFSLQDEAMETGTMSAFAIEDRLDMTSSSLFVIHDTSFLNAFGDRFLFSRELQTRTPLRRLTVDVVGRQAEALFAAVFPRWGVAW